MTKPLVFKNPRYGSVGTQKTNLKKVTPVVRKTTEIDSSNKSSHAFSTGRITIAISSNI